MNEGYRTTDAVVYTPMQVGGVVQLGPDQLIVVGELSYLFIYVGEARRISEDVRLRHSMCAEVGRFGWRALDFGECHAASMETSMKRCVPIQRRASLVDGNINTDGCELEWMALTSNEDEGQ